MRVVFAITLLGLMAACATNPPPLTEERRQLAAHANRPLVCADAADCAVKWGRAVEWVAANSAYRLQIQTDTVIQTAGPLPHEVRSAFFVSKAPNPDGGATITFRSGCDNAVWGCQPDELELRGSFARYVLDGQ